MQSQLDEMRASRWPWLTGFVTRQLAVCADYRFSFAPEIHSTEMLFVLGTPKNRRTASRFGS
jgi:hypothetical protein